MERKRKQRTQIRVLNRDRFQGIWRPESKKLDIYQYDDTDSALTFYPDLIESHDFPTYTKAENCLFDNYIYGPAG